MVYKSKEIIPADLHTPEELLIGAESLLTSDDPQLMRAVVLEAISALETYVNRTVFGILETKLDPLLVKWLKEKTKSNFDARIEVFTPVAIGRYLGKDDILWDNYKKAKEIRNRITHSGAKVTKLNARFVVETVYAWLAYLGSTAEVELSILGLKKFVEREKLKITNEREAASLVGEYFKSTKAAAMEFEKSHQFGGINEKVDSILRFGNHTILIETKFLSSIQNFETVYKGIIEETKSYLDIAQITRGAIILFCKDHLNELFNTVKTVEGGRISIVGVKVD